MSKPRMFTPAILLSSLFVGCIEYGLDPSKEPASGAPSDEDVLPIDPEPIDDVDTDTGDDPEGGGRAVPSPDPWLEIELEPEPEPEPDPCDGRRTTVRVDVDFPETAECSWGAGDNLSALDARVRALETQEVAIDLGADVPVCDVRFEFAESEGGMGFMLQYDDQLMLTLNERIIVATDRRMVVDQPTDADGLLVFDWAEVRDMEMDFHPEPWAIGHDYELEMPSHDTVGPAFIAVEDAALSSLRTAATEELVFSLHAFGDNDPTDCSHTGVGFWVELDVPAE